MCPCVCDTQLGTLVSVLRERAVDWDLMVVETSNLERRVWMASKPPPDTKPVLAHIPEVGPCAGPCWCAHRPSVCVC
jgi:hypothetical protein